MSKMATFRPRIVDLKSLLWWTIVILQILGSSYLRQHVPAMSSLIDNYVNLAFGFNLAFGLIYFLNFIIRQFFVINDTSYFLISRLNLQIQIQYIIDIICGLVALGFLISAGSIMIQGIS